MDEAHTELQRVPDAIACWKLYWDMEDFEVRCCTLSLRVILIVTSSSEQNDSGFGRKYNQCRSSPVTGSAIALAWGNVDLQMAIESQVLHMFTCS
jgi:hypothetical protein